MAGVVSKQPVKETTFPLQAEEPGAEGKQPDVKTDAYDLADTDLTVWYEDPSYEDFFEYAARQYFEQTGVKAAFKCQDILDYIGMIYDNTMQGEDYPAAPCKRDSMQNNPHSRRVREIFPAFLGKVRKETLSAAPPSQALPRQLPQRGSQAVKFSTKVLGAMRKFPAVLLALPLGELSPQVTERAQQG